MITNTLINLRYTPPINPPSINQSINQSISLFARWKDSNQISIYPNVNTFSTKFDKSKALVFGF